MADEFQSVMDDVETARTAIKAGDWSTAETYLISAEAGLAIIPDSRHGEQEHRFRQTIGELLKTVRTKAASATASSRGIQSTLITPI